MNIFKDIDTHVDQLVTVKTTTSVDQDAKTYTHDYVVFNYLVKPGHPLPILESEQATLSVAKESIEKIKFALKVSLTLLVTKELTDAHRTD